MIQNIESIPRLPQITMELINQAFQEEPDIQTIATTVEKDPSLAVQLFKTVNSAAFGLRTEVKSIPQAISIMGLDALRSTVVSLTVGDYFVNHSLGQVLDTKKFCLHSLATAVIMKKTAQAIGIKEVDQLYLIGLLHDLGMIALDSLPDKDYGKVVQSVENGKSVDEAELKVYGWNNRQVWLLLAGVWEFPDEIIKMYEGSLEGNFSLTTQKLIEDASRLTDSLGFHFIQLPAHEKPEEGDVYSSLNAQAVEEIGRSAREQVGVLCDVLDLPPPDSTDINQALLKMTHQLSKANAENAIIRKELELRVTVLEELTHVYTGIIKTVDNDSLILSVLEAITKGFHVDGTFLITQDTKGGFKGYKARSTESGEVKISPVQLDKNQLSLSLQSCMESKNPVKIMNPAESDVLTELLDKLPLDWLTNIHLRGSVSSILGVGTKERQSVKFNSDDFGKILNIVAAEVGLSMVNSQLYKRMRKEARFDALTNIFNRRTIMRVLTSEFARFKRKSTPLSVAIFDLDNFKAINDTRGHLAGDEYLVKIVEILKKGIREADYIGRYGGDEFMAIFPDTPSKDIFNVVERIRSTILELCAEIEGPDLGKKLSVSIGVAGAQEDMNKPEELINLSDTALYKAKEEGRNRTVLLENDPSVVA